MKNTPYGSGAIMIPQALFSNKRRLDILSLPSSSTQFMDNKDNTSAEIIKALDSPFSRLSVCDCICSGDTMAVIVPDLTRNARLKTF